MKILAVAVVCTAAFAAVPAGAASLQSNDRPIVLAQGLDIQVGPGYDRRRDWDDDRDVRRERRWRDDRSDRRRDSDGECRTVTIERDDGSLRRVRRCD